ncbi:hypothetical protein RB614_35025 [Phytohabitans sp. ZYX-F-186]|uniref:Cyclase n=1 Tax=Phytohabitans maris TaxID=3071409 RepID=A0ABU0ZRU4_9ACTN|nr:hypothetical protein [Phytohabitans sp. ZYX-F-186]MDQ7909748.1 hypothetical protein [Phytohabitans sp. ZYX-F-186]
MFGINGRRVAAGSVAVAIGGLGAVAVQSPARASDFSAAYTCTAPVLGTQNVTIDGSLTATPNPAAAGTVVDFDLHISQVSLTAPVAINSWTITADLDVSGAETAQFQVSGSGGGVPANQPISGDLAGTWTPTAAGTDEIRGGDVTVNANVVLLGNITIDCTPDEPRPVAETLAVS